MHRYQTVSILSALLLLISATSLYAARSSRQYQQRGTTVDFPQPVQGAESLLAAVNVSLEQYDDATLDARLNDLASHGVRYVRQEFRWTDMEPAQGQMNWVASDRIFAAARRNHIQVLADLLTTPVWVRADSGSGQSPAVETMPPRNPQNFAAFARAFAQRYDKPIVDGTPAILAYQVWDEPNLSAAWGNGIISPVGYLKLLRAAGGAIKSVHPAARIVLAGLAPTVEQSDVNLSPELYLRKLYDAGGRDAFDIAAAKPYGFDLPPDDRRASTDVMNFSRTILIRDEMVAHGDGQKALWLTQWGWNAQLPDWNGQPSIWGNVSETEQAQYTTQAVQRVAREWYWVGAMFLSTLQPSGGTDDPRWGFSLLDQQGRPRPVYDAFTSAIRDAAAAPRAQRAAIALSVPVTDTQMATSNPQFGPNPAASYSDGWRFSELGADIPQRDDAHVTFHFSGDALAMVVRRDNYRAYMFVTVDGKPANLLPEEPRGAYLIMTSPDQLPHVDTIPVANNLGPGDHVAEVKMDRGWNQWALIGWSSRSAPSSELMLADTALPLAAALLVLSVIGLVISLPRAHWLERLRGRGPINRSLTWQSIVAALLVWLTASLTWAADAATAYRNLGTPANLVLTGFVSAVAFWSPLFVISLVALVVLFVLVLLRLDIGLALLAFFIPFYLIPQHIFAKAFPMVELLTFMCLASWVVRKVREWRLAIGDSRLGKEAFRQSAFINLRSLITNFSTLDWALIALVVVAGLSASQADFKVEALRELRMVFIEPVILYLLLRTTKPGTERIWRIADSFVLGAVAIAVIGLVNYARGNVFSADLGIPRIRSVYGSPNNDALYLSRAFPLLLAMVLFGRWTYDPPGNSRPRNTLLSILSGRRFLYGVGLALVSVAILLSVSRGALLLGIPAAFISVCLVGGGRWRYLGIALLACLVVGLGVMLSGVATPLLAGTRFANALDLSQGTGFFRLNLWQSALVMFRDHPILGVGPDNFLYAYRGFYILPAAWQEPNLSHPHDIILDFATRLGILGLLVGIGLLIGLFHTARGAYSASRQTNLFPLAVGLIGLLVDMAAHGMVDHSLFLVDLSYVFMLACGLLVMLSRYDRTGESRSYER
jgi:O-antigen ligase